MSIIKGDYMESYGYGKAYGKVILIGEHSVVYHKPAIALPLKDLKVETYITKSNEDITIDSIFYQGFLKNASNLEGIKALVLATHLFLNKKPEKIHIKIDSKVPEKRGLGSSAAVSVSVVRALFDYYKEKLTLETLKKLTHQAEIIHHIDPSGLDAETVLSEEAIFFVKYQAIEKIEVKLNGVLLVADTGIHGHTKDAVSNVKKLLTENEPKVRSYMDELENLTLQAKMFIKTQEIEKLGKTLTKAHQILDKLEISNQTLNDLVDLALKNHALGAKLTGGGKGGSMIALMRSKEDALKLKDIFHDYGLKNVWLHNLKGE
mgnify:CR=1 FL=1